MLRGLGVGVQNILVRPSDSNLDYENVTVSLRIREYSHLKLQ